MRIAHIGNAGGGQQQSAPGGWVAVAEYTYDALGRRIRAAESNGTTLTAQDYYYDGQRVLAEFGSTGKLLRYYVDGGAGGPGGIDEHVLVRVGKLDYVYVPRELNTVGALLNAGGGLHESYDYDAYGLVRMYNSAGNLIAKSGTGQQYFFTGRRLDRYESTLANPRLDLYHYRARAYTPTHGRFLQRDPLGYLDGMNLYEYVQSKPSVFADPTGRGVITYLLEGNWEVSDWEYSTTYAGSVANDAWTTSKTVVGGVYAVVSSSEARAEFLVTYEETVIEPNAGRILGKHQTFNPYSTDVASYGGLAYQAMTDFVGTDLIAEAGYGVDLATGQALDREARLHRWLQGSSSVVLTGIALKAAFTCKAGNPAVSSDRPLPILHEQSTNIPLRIAEAHELLTKIATQAEHGIGGAGRVAGTLKHTLAARLGRAAGRSDLRFEQSYRGRQFQRRGYGKPGTVRADAVLGDLDAPLAVFDFKFGEAGLTSSRIKELSAKLPAGTKIIVVRPAP